MATKCPKCHLENPETKQFCAECGTKLSPSAPPEIGITRTVETPTEKLTRGTIFAGRYEIIEELGKGGMGNVYRVFDKKVESEVALKLIKPEVSADKKTIDRFRNELRLAREIAHPHVCRMYDLNQERDAYYITMEYVAGEDLRSMIRMSKQLSVVAAVSIAKQVCEGLAEAHRRKVVHRDLKPSNIMIDHEGNARIMDFGIARSLITKGITGEGMMIGTPEYMSPEQAEAKDLDHRSDLYSLGAVLYEMVTGRMPFEGDTPLAIAMKLKGEIPKSPKALNAQIPDALSQVILRCLEKNREKRYQSAEELSSDLERVEKELPTTQEEVSRRKPFTSREISVKLPVRKVLIPGFAIVAIILIGLALRVFRPKDTHPASSLLSMSVQQLTDLAGAEEFPDISPDGNFIVYSKTHAGGSDLFLQRVPGGKPINITNSPTSENNEPSFSPNGQFIAFRSDRDGGGVFVMGSTGEAVRKLSDEGYYPSWSPDGTSVACCSDSNVLPFDRSFLSKLWIVNAKTGEKRLLSEGDVMQPKWSPHGYRIAFWAIPGWGFLKERSKSVNRDIYTVSVNGSDYVAVTDDAYIDWNPVWSPDGRYLYYASDRGGSMNLWRVAIDERTGKVLAKPEPVTTPARQMGRFRIAQDGERFLYESRDMRSAIYAARFDPGSKAITETPNRVAEYSKLFIQPSISPDGTWLALSTDETLGDIYLMRTDGSEIRQLTNDLYRDRAPDWSPDGTEISFYSSREGFINIWTLHPDGSGLRPLTNLSDIEGTWFPQWFPDRSRMVFYNNSGTFIVDLSRPIEDRKAEKAEPELPPGCQFESSEISPDGDKLVGWVVDSTGTTQNIAVYSLADRTLETLSISASDLAWLNDSRRVIYLDQGRFYLVDTRTKQGQAVRGSPEGVFGFALTKDNRQIYFLRHSREVDLCMGTFK